MQTQQQKNIDKIFTKLKIKSFLILSFYRITDLFSVLYVDTVLWQTLSNIVNNLLVSILKVKWLKEERVSLFTSCLLGHVVLKNLVLWLVDTNIGTDKQLLNTMQWRCLEEWRKAPPFSTSALNRGKWTVSRHHCFSPRERAHGTQWAGGWVGPTAGLDTMAKRKILPLSAIEPWPSSPQPIKIHIELSYK